MKELLPPQTQEYQERAREVAEKYARPVPPSSTAPATTPGA